MPLKIYTCKSCGRVRAADKPVLPAVCPCPCGRGLMWTDGVTEELAAPKPKQDPGHAWVSWSDGDKEFKFKVNQWCGPVRINKFIFTNI